MIGHESAVCYCTLGIALAKVAFEFHCHLFSNCLNYYEKFVICNAGLTWNYIVVFNLGKRKMSVEGFKENDPTFATR